MQPLTTVCPICLEIPDLPVSINISEKKKCPFIQNNLICLRCITNMITHNPRKFIVCGVCNSDIIDVSNINCNICGSQWQNDFNINMKCLCNSHNIDVLNNSFRCYGDVYHYSEEFVEQELWNSLYYTNKKCNLCFKEFDNIKELYEHYKYYGNTCFPIQKNKNKYIILLSILILNLINQFIIYYYLNYCNINVEDFYLIEKRYCLDECKHSICNHLYKNNKQFAVIILTSYYLTVEMFLENVKNLCNDEKFVWKTIHQLCNVIVLIYFLTILYFNVNNLNDYILFYDLKQLIQLSFEMKICFKFYSHLCK